MVHPDRLPHFPVDLPASNFGSAVGHRWFGLGDLSVPAARLPSVPTLHRCRLRPRGDTPGVLAHGDGCERSTMEGAGQRGGGTPMKGAVRPTLASPRDVRPTPPAC